MILGSKNSVVNKMTKLLEDIKLLKNDRDFLSSTKQIIENNKEFNSIPDYDKFILLANDIDKRIVELNTLIERKEKEYDDKAKLKINAKKITIIILIPFLILIILLQYLSYGNLSFVTSILLLSFLFIMNFILSEGSFLNRNLFAILFIALLLIISCSLFPYVKILVDKYSGIVTLLALIYAVITTKNEKFI
jgi:hypothetical protein